MIAFDLMEVEALFTLALTTRNLFYKGLMEFQLVLSLILQYTFLTAFEQKD